MTGSRMELALVKGQARGNAGRSAGGSFAGDGRITGGASERRGTLGQGAERRRTLGKGEGAAHHAHSSDADVLHCDWYRLIGRYIKVKNGET